MGESGPAADDGETMTREEYRAAQFASNGKARSFELVLQSQTIPTHTLPHPDRAGLVTTDQHADEGGVYGNWMIEELRRHGYKISPGTLYPMLRAMEKDGWILGEREAGGNRRHLYTITTEGRKALREARAKLRELF